MLRTTEVDGVPALIAPSAGAMSAGLMFRVGQADETLAEHGVTHLVEHLALHDSGLSDHHYNGETSSVYTHFHLRGSESDVVDFLGRVCAALSGLPMYRLETEKEILRTESRTRGPLPGLPLRRYGAQGYGLPGCPEWGLARLGPDDLRRWAARWFTRQNAVLWIAGADVPAGLRLRLPEGARRPVPPAAAVLPRLPAYYPGDGTGVLASAVVRRSTAASVYSGVLERELYRDLRQEGGHSYTASSSYEPRGDGYATVTAYADALPEKQDAVLGGFTEVLARMRRGELDARSVTAVRTKALENLNHPEIEATRLPGHALNLLTGQRHLPVDELRAELAAVTDEQVHAVAAEAAGTTLLQVPRGTAAAPAGFAPAPTSSPAEVAGHRYAPRDAAAARLVIGPDAVGITRPGSRITVRYRECAALLAWPDGARRLIGYDGVTLHLEPALWSVPDTALAAVDAGVAAARHIPMPPRDPDGIPRNAPAVAAGPMRRLLANARLFLS
ncbi:hypothetical protein CS0771_01610 [Catellatospora sp. IY07-71]|uniref:M16 family metallopeptidase n=1 Tax=Catellatospora sp. IY07-71 TaxID=2728827 RepID=UPI001BB30F16|nr:insulinase family protein [Catellatospora sp. IY07-71]BCJ70617.1 hypothetical protein CS0771_01610 [Catellatospora sp. IY07-71]